MANSNLYLWKLGNFHTAKSTTTWASLQDKQNKNKTEQTNKNLSKNFLNVVNFLVLLQRVKTRNELDVGCTENKHNKCSLLNFYPHDSIER